MGRGPFTVALSKHGFISETESNPLAVTTYVVTAAGVPLSLAAIVTEPTTVFFVAAILWGWSEIDGLCGSSHLCSLTPLRGLDRTGRLWLKAVSAYSISGTVTALCVGAVVGLIGRVIWAAGLPLTFAYTTVAVVALILMLRELGCIRFQLPQVRRQTHKMWAFRFGFVTGAGMWGAHIGLGFATVIQHGGFYIVVAMAMLLGPKYGALLFAVYWFGRTLPMWVGPALNASLDSGVTLSDLAFGPNSACRYIAAVGLLLGAAAAVILTVSR